MKKVSIIVPAYNVEKYIKDCITSLIKQTYSNIEIIIIDDGSSDNSKMICENIKKDDSRILLFSKKNEGVSSARNLGLNYVSGELVTFIDSDDYVEYNYIEEMVNSLGENDMAVCGYKERYINSTFCQKIIKKYETINNLVAISSLFQKGSYGGYLWNKIFKTDIIRDYNINFDEEIHMCEDMLFIIKYLINSNDICLIPKELYYYRMRKTSAVWNNDNDKYSSLYKSYNEIYSILINKKLELDYFYYEVLNSIFSKNLSLTVSKKYFDFDIMSAYKMICISQRISNKDKIKLKIKKEFNYIYDMYMDKKIKENELFE